MGWQTRSSRTVYQNRWIRVLEDEVLRPDGVAGIYGVLEVRSPAVFVVAVTPGDEVVLVEIDRYTLDQPSLEMPGGATDGEEPLVAARRELLEETGLVAGSWRDLGQVYSLNGVTRAPGRVVLAEDVRLDPDAAASTAAEQAAEGILAVRLVPLADLPALIASGSITDNEALGALLLALVALDHVRCTPARVSLALPGGRGASRTSPSDVGAQGAWLARAAARTVSSFHWLSVRSNLS